MSFVKILLSWHESFKRDRGQYIFGNKSCHVRQVYESWVCLRADKYVEQQMQATNVCGPRLRIDIANCKNTTVSVSNELYLHKINKLPWIMHNVLARHE
jgi:hypothetical protein